MNQLEKHSYEHLRVGYEKSYKRLFFEIFDKNFKYKKVYYVNQDRKELISPGCQMYCYPMFVQPGKAAFLIRTEDEESKKTSFTQFQIVGDVREEEVPLIDEGAVGETKKKEFIREITIFADYRVDDARIMD